ncbi:hypothetical protein B0H12DRAFT_428702 [Mycena haematopus]|nr:hypothetical protein B0H12DRAFT_428702 [Mycena haematopus]
MLLRNACWRSDLVRLIRKLHAAGVHHHDVFGNTVAADHGTIWLVDFHKAELVPPGAICPGCDDEDSIMVLELEGVHSKHFGNSIDAVVKNRIRRPLKLSSTM